MVISWWCLMTKIIAVMMLNYGDCPAMWINKKNRKEKKI